MNPMIAGLNGNKMSSSDESMCMSTVCFEAH
jgi:tryptophanyl-tRNA synthetase